MGFFVFAFLAAFGGGSAAVDEDVAIDVGLLKSGDVILQTTTSSQAPAIVLASGSRWSHVGIVAVERGGVFVVEASGRVQKTPLQRFLRRGVGGMYTVLRHHDVDDARGAAIVAQAKKHLGAPYDVAFSRGDRALYCSELVAVAFHDAGLDVGAWQKVGDLHLDNPVVERLIERRWRKHPACKGANSLAACQARLKDTEIVTPGSISDDEGFSVVASSYPPGLR
jgi:hypothetical protein